LEFRVNPKERAVQPKVHQKDFELARNFAKRLYKEFGTFISALVLFGSVTFKEEKAKDIDILVVIDDVRIRLSPEIMETYRVIIEKAIIDLSPRIHIQTMKLTSFWEYVRAGDPVAVNILRSGIALIDTGFFDPLQALLDTGRIRPTKESIQSYFAMAYASLSSSRSHLISAVLDLYWASIDAAHSALMKLGGVPPSPEHVADELKEKMVKRKYLKVKYVNFMREMYVLSKKITNKEISFISGEKYDELSRETSDFVKVMKSFVEKEIK
jgi:predicted nucleotidyltransferase